MQLLNNGSQVSTLPAPRAPVGVQGYFANCNPQTGELGSSLDADIMNAVIEEIRQVLAWGNQLPPNQLVFTQLRDAIVTGCNGLIQTALAALPPSPTGGGVPDGLTVIEYSGDGTGNFTVPDGVSKLLVELWGGGGGANGSNLDPGGAGGGGGYVLALLDVTAGQVIPYAVGAGGAGTTDAAVALVGGSGGASSFGALVAGGGGGGGHSGQSGSGGVGTLPPGSRGFAIAGQAGDDLATVGDQKTARGGNAPRGGSGGTAGSSPGGDGSVPGGGGGAMWNSATSGWLTAGNGAPGRIVIYWGGASGNGGGGGTAHPLLLTQQGGNIGGLIDLAGGVFSLSAPVTAGGGNGPTIATQAGGNVGGTIDFVNGTFSLTAPAGSGGGSGAIPNVVSLPPEAGGFGTFTWVVPAGVSRIFVELYSPPQQQGSGDQAVLKRGHCLRAVLSVSAGQSLQATLEGGATYFAGLSISTGAGVQDGDVPLFTPADPTVVGSILAGVSTEPRVLIWY